MNDRLANVFECTFTLPAPMPYWDKDLVAEWTKERGFYDGTAEYTFAGHYCPDPKKNPKLSEDQLKEDAARRLGIRGTPDKSQARDIAEYMTRFNTAGAFDLHGTMTQREVDAWKAAARTTKSIIWHGYLSVPPSRTPGMTNDGMARLVRQTFGKFLDDAGFCRDNIALFCTAHSDTDHIHVHFAFYEKAPLYLDKYGKAHYRERGKLPQEALTNYRLSTTAYLMENKEDFFSYRDIATSYIRGCTDRPLAAVVYEELRALKEALPREGRLSYNSENMAPYRSKIDGIAIMLLKTDPEAYRQHQKALREIARRGRELAELKRTNTNYVAALTAEYKSRLGNAVIALARKMRFEPLTRNGALLAAEKTRRPSARRKRKAGARRARQYNKRAIDALVRTLCSPTRVRTDFTLELHKAEYEIEISKKQGSK